MFGNWDWVHKWCKDQDVFILGSGPSVTPETIYFINRRQLAGAKVIVLSWAIYEYPIPPDLGAADVFCYLDFDALIVGLKPELHRIKRVVTRGRGNLRARGNVTVMHERPSRRQPTMDPADGLSGSRTTASIGIHLAIQGRAKNIYLAGVDCRIENRKAKRLDNSRRRFHGRGGNKLDDRDYEKMADELKQFRMGNIYKLSDFSRAPFPFKRIEEI